MSFTIERALAEEPLREDLTELAEPWIIDSDVGCSWSFVYPTVLEPEAETVQRRRALAAVGRALSGLAVLERHPKVIPLDLIPRPGVAVPEFEARAREMDFRDLMAKLEAHAGDFMNMDMHLWLYLFVRETFGCIERRVIRSGAIVFLYSDEFEPHLRLTIFFTHGLFAPWIYDYDNRRVARHNRPTLRRILGTLNEALPEWEKSWEGQDYERMRPDGYELPPPAPDEDDEPWEDWMGAID
jgi:hypothetical protein